MRSFVRISLLSLLGASLVPAVALADHETRQDRRELREDRREAMDDRMDDVRLRQLLVRFDRARAFNDVGALAGIERELYGLLDAELRESHQALAKDQRELDRSRREREDHRRDRRWGDRRWGDRRWGDDRRDRADDVRAVRSEAIELDQKRAILAELYAVAGRQDPAALDYRRERIVRLLNLGQQELHKDDRERREDRRELREDRRDERRR